MYQILLLNSWKKKKNKTKKMMKKKYKYIYIYYLKISFKNMIYSYWILPKYKFQKSFIIACLWTVFYFINFETYIKPFFSL